MAQKLVLPHSAQNIWFMRTGFTPHGLFHIYQKERALKKFFLSYYSRDDLAAVEQTSINQLHLSGVFLSKQVIKPSSFFVSPYKRSKQSAKIILEHLTDKPKVEVLDNLRPIDLGINAMLTDAGLHKYQPMEYERKRRENQLYYRPSCGESLVDMYNRSKIDVMNAVIGNKDNILFITHGLNISMILGILYGYSLDKIWHNYQKDAIKHGALICLQKQANNTYGQLLYNHLA